MNTIHYSNDLNRNKFKINSPYYTESRNKFVHTNVFIYDFFIKTIEFRKIEAFFYSYIHVIIYDLLPNEILTTYVINPKLME